VLTSEGQTCSHRRTFTKREEKHEAFLFSQARSSLKPRFSERQRNCFSARLAQELAFLVYACIRGNTSSTSKRNDVVSGNPSFLNWKEKSTVFEKAGKRWQMMANDGK